VYRGGREEEVNITMATRTVPEDRTTRYFVLAQLAEACSRAAEAEAEAEVSRRVRDDAIRRAKGLGVSLREIASLSGLSKARVQQVAPGIDDEGGFEGNGALAGTGS
jgi:hypothetical protein